MLDTFKKTLFQDRVSYFSNLYYLVYNKLLDQAFTHST